MTDSGVAFETIADLARRIRAGELSPVALAERLLDRIATHDPSLHAFIAVTGERALREAERAEQELRSGRDRGPLHGIPYAVKDLFDVQGLATTAGTRLRDAHRAQGDAAAVRKLGEAGMALLGKNYTLQLAYGVAGINSDQGTPRNPWSAVPYAPGGSSSGSAVAVAAGMTPVSLGTDTGGSVRIPAALCGVVGLKTTVGRVSRAGVYTLSWSLDSVGPITRTVEDAALVYLALQGEDPLDVTTHGVLVADPLPSLRVGARGLRLALPETLFLEDVDPEIESAVREAGRVLHELGADVRSLAIPEVADAWAVEHRALWIASQACAGNRDLLDHHLDELDPLVAPRMLLGRNLSASDYLEVRRRFAALRVQLLERLRDVDAMLVPTTLSAARPIDAVRAPYESYLVYSGRLGRNAGIGNLLGLCAVSLPCGFTAEGLPIGLMIYAKPFQEEIALRVAHAYERATEWHAHHPDLRNLGNGGTV